MLPLEDRVIGPCPINGPMLRRCFGKDAWLAVQNQTVICSGVLLGTPRAFAALRVIAKLVQRCPVDKMSDQASLNYAVWSAEGLAALHQHLAPEAAVAAPEATVAVAEGAAPRAAPAPIRIVTQKRGTGVANTVGIFKGAERTARFEKLHMRAGWVLNDDGVPSPVVHQYDRILKSSSPTGVYGKSESLLRLQAVDDALGQKRSDASWMVAGA